MLKVQSNITSFGEERWMILHNNSQPIIPVMKFIKHKDSLGKASNTLKTYCYHLKIFWCFQNEKNKDYEHIKHVPDFRWEQVLENLYNLDSEIA